MYCVNYHRAISVTEAVSRVASGSDARFLSGGMTLIPAMKTRLSAPSEVVDVMHIAELKGISVSGPDVRIGAATTHAEVAGSATLQAAVPALCHLAGHIGDPHVRHKGTIGGSIANNDPAADYPAAVLALGATIVTDRREIAADDYFQGMFATALDAGELIVRIAFPVPTRAAYEKFAHPASGYAMTGVFVAETAGGIRVGVTGAGPGVFRWKEAEAALAKKFAAESVAALRMTPDDLNEDIHGSREYRANLVNVLTKRAVARIAGR